MNQADVFLFLELGFRFFQEIISGRENDPWTFLKSICLFLKNYRCCPSELLAMAHILTVECSVFGLSLGHL